MLNGSKPTGSELQEMFNKTDKDHNRTIELSKSVELMGIKGQGDQDKELLHLPFESLTKMGVEKLALLS